MGLPSGIRWASMNIGARSPEQSGLFFSWGNVEGHAEGSGYNFSQEEYNTTPGAAINTDLSTEEDAANTYLGGSWRMPTSDEFKELCDNCTTTWVSRNGVNGRLFTSNINGNTLFFPAAGNYEGTTLYERGARGNYWASTFYSAAYARLMRFSGSEINPQTISDRPHGFTIRAVRD